MEANYTLASNDVLISKDSKYLKKVDSAQTFIKKFCDDSKYEISFCDISIKLMQDSHFTDGILMEICEENENGNCSFVDIVISDLIGTFISDWF